MNTDLGRIGPFELVRRLAKGGMGEVFLARDPSCDRIIALKKIRDDLRKHKTLKTRFFREAKIAARLTHPSIMPIYSISQDPENAYYTMPYIEGETLKQILLRESSVPALIQIFLSICQAVAYAHSKGILHRDLKTDNVIVGKFGEVMILDWGIAVELEQNHEELADVSGSHDLTHPGKIPGTLSHLAPERIQGEKATVLSEIYALGVLLYQLLTLRLPFQRSSIEEMRKKRTPEELIPPEKIAPYRDISPQLSAIALRSLSARKEERYQSVQEMIDELQNYIEGRPEWILTAELSIAKKEDWEFQENILLAKHLAITRTPEVMEWVNLMFSRASFPGNIKIETRVLVGASGKGIGILLGIPEASERIGFADGYSLWMSSEPDHPSRLFRSNVEVMPIEGLLERQIWHAICIEKLDNHLSLYIDGRLRCRYVSHRPMMGTHVGLLFRDADFHMHPLKISLGSQTVQINCLAVPDAFLASRLYGTALSEYRRIGYSFPGRAEGREALFRAGVTLLEQALAEPKKGRRQRLFSLALEEFGKLRQTPGAPLEYLGKSLVYKALGEIEEEAKCLELALRKYPKHPLLPLLVEEIGFRLHESSAQNRRAGLLFALLALRQLPQLFSSQENKKFLESLKKSLEPLPFFENANVDVQLAFWLAKPVTLLEIFEQNADPAVRKNVLFALLYLGCFDMVKELDPPEWVLLAEKRPASALKEAQDPHAIGFLTFRLQNRHLLSHIDEPQTSPELILRTLLLEKEWKKAGQLFSSVDTAELENPASPFFLLYGCFLRSVKGEKAALRHFSDIDQFAHPPLASLLAYELQHKLDWNSLLHWEKLSLLRDLVLYYTCARSPKARLWQKKLRKMARCTD